MIKDGDEFTIIYSILPPEHHNQLIASFQGHWQDLIKNVSNFKYIYEILPTEHQKQLIASVQGRWQNLIKKVYDFKDIYRILPTEHQNKLIISLLNAELTGHPSIHASINQLLEQPSNLWSERVLNVYLQKLDSGIKALQKNCSSKSIECFLQALFSQNPEQIAFASQNLIDSARNSIFVFFKKNAEQQITQILQAHFASFMPKSLVLDTSPLKNLKM